MPESFHTWSPGRRSAGVLQSLTSRFGFPNATIALTELGLLEPRSAVRYQAAEILPLYQWRALEDALRRHDPERAEVLIRPGALVRLGCLLHQQVDEAEAAHRDVPRTHRFAVRACAARVADVGDRLLAGEALGGDDLLLVPRFVRTQTTPRGLRRKGADAIAALWDQRLHLPDAVSGHGDVLLREALRNLDAGPAADTAVEVLAGSAARDAVPSAAAAEMVYVNSPEVARAVAGLVGRGWSRHEGVIYAAWRLRSRTPLDDMSDGSSMAHLPVVRVAVQYLGDATSSLRLSAADQARAAELLRNAEQRLGGWSSADREAVTGSCFCDATGRSLDDDALVRALWSHLLLTRNAEDCDRAAQMLLNLGATLEEPLTSLIGADGLSLTLRISALAGLRVFGAAHSEPTVRGIALDRSIPMPLRLEALWNYAPHKGDTRWMLGLLADPDPEIRRALMIAARDRDVAGVLLAGLVEDDPGIRRLAGQELDRLERQGKLDLSGVAFPRSALGRGVWTDRCG